MADAWPETSIARLRIATGFRPRDGVMGLSFNRGDAASEDGFKAVPGIAERLAAEMAEWPQTEEERLRRVAKVEADMVKLDEHFRQMATEHAEGRIGDVPVSRG